MEEKLKSLKSDEVIEKKLLQLLLWNASRYFSGCECNLILIKLHSLP